MRLPGRVSAHRLATIAGGLGFAVLAAYLVTPPLARLDDAYIALHSARVLLSGRDPIFGVPALAGATSPIHVAAIAALLGIGVRNGDVALRLVNASGIVAFAAAVWHLGTIGGLSFGRRAALVVMALSSGLVLLNLTNGMETGWAMAVLTFAIARAQARRGIDAACAAGLLPFLRPDLAPASALVLLYAARERSRQEQVGLFALAAAVAVPWLIWVRIDTGNWLPQTMRAKQFAYAQGCLPAAQKARTVIGGAGDALVQLLPLSLGLIALPRNRLGFAGLAAIVTTLFGYYVAFPGAITHNYWRYFYPVVVPWLCLGLTRGLGRVKTLVALTVAVTVAIMQLALPGPRINAESAGFANDLKTSSEWLDAHVPEDAVILVHDAGGVSEFAHRRAIDLIGLKTPSSIAAHERWTWPTCGGGFGTAVAAIARESGASYLIARGLWEAPIRGGLQADGFVLTAERRPTSYEGGYTVYRLERPFK